MRINLFFSLSTFSTVYYNCSTRSVLRTMRLVSFYFSGWQPWFINLGFLQICLVKRVTKIEHKIKFSICYGTQPVDCNGLFPLLLIPGEYSSRCWILSSLIFWQSDWRSILVYLCCIYTFVQYTYFTSSRVRVFLPDPLLVHNNIKTTKVTKASKATKIWSSFDVNERWRGLVFPQILVTPPQKKTTTKKQNNKKKKKLARGKI